MNMEDEMGEYRDRIEKRRENRRAKNDRRVISPALGIDWSLVMDAVMFAALLLALYFWR